MPGELRATADGSALPSRHKERIQRAADEMDGALSDPALSKTVDKGPTPEGGDAQSRDFGDARNDVRDKQAKFIEAAEEASTAPPEGRDAAKQKLQQSADDLNDAWKAVLAEIQARLVPWFATVPQELVWIVSHCGAPRVNDFGSWLSTAAWTLEEALGLAEDPPDFDPTDLVPNVWSKTIGHALGWEIASYRGLTISSTYWPPRALVDTPFLGLPNPFVPLLHLWRCGVMLDTTFSKKGPAIVYVNAPVLGV